MADEWWEHLFIWRPGRRHTTGTRAPEPSGLRGWEEDPGHTSQ